jgi:hypothetical protein
VPLPASISTLHHGFSPVTSASSDSETRLCQPPPTRENRKLHRGYMWEQHRRRGMSTGRATPEIDAGIASSVPFPARGPSLNPQATAFQPRPVQSRRQHSAASASRNKTTLSLRANVFFKSSSFRRLCDEAFQLALSPPPTKPPSNYEVGTTPLHPHYASLVTNFSTLFFDLASRRTPPLEPRALEDASAKHLTTIFASFAGAHVPCSCISAVAKDEAFPVLADTALQRQFRFRTGPYPITGAPASRSTGGGASARSRSTPTGAGSWSASAGRCCS